MPEVEFEPTIPVFQRAKTVHALDRAATVIDNFMFIDVSNVIQTDGGKVRPNYWNRAETAINCGNGRLTLRNLPGKFNFPH
jgi:hypothetical protein